MNAGLLEGRSEGSAAVAIEPDGPAFLADERPGAAIETATLHALFWLVASSAAGGVMALLLVAPSLGGVLGPFGFGRWAPVHLDLALYGWLALPVVALLLRGYGLGGRRGGPGVVAVHAWSASLFAGAFSWLAGEAGGKVFLDWHGPALLFFVAAMAALACVLALGLWRARPPAASKAVLWVALCAVPLAIVFATDSAVYPPVNPASGGPTGADLLGSTLGLVAILVAAPALLGWLRPSDRRATAVVAALLVLHGLLAFAASRSEGTHREPIQIIAVVSVLPWIWLTPRYLNRFAWPEETGPWRRATLAWGLALAASGVLAFLPGVLDRVKFTNVLVGHAHVAMAGMATSFAALVLVSLNAGGRLRGVLSGRLPFALWHAGCAVNVAAVTAVGLLEAGDPGILFRPAATVDLLYAVRAGAGGAMLAAAGLWLRDGTRGVAS